jgi:formamidopyrimidine-DNA glycosylase
MPELPEVETVVRGLREPLVGRTVTRVWYENTRVIHMPSAEQFAQQIVGQQCIAINRRAKYIVCTLSQDIFAVHLKMTGRLYVVAPGQTTADDRWIRVKFDLSDGNTLCFSDARRFGRVYLAQRIEDFAPDIGPEPLEDDFTVEVLRQRLHGRSKMIKALLLDQSFVAGVGNIYADEALFRAKIHPERRADSLTKAETARLYQTIRDALTDGIQYEGASINWYRKPDGTTGESQEHFFAYDREGKPCVNCGTPIRKIRVAQRGTHFCPSCQPEKK